MQEYWNDLERHVGGTGMHEIWLDQPLCRRAVNRRISDNPDTWPTDWLMEQLASVSPLGRTLSIGSGTGAFERDLVSKNIVGRVTGIDLAAEPLKRARQLAHDADMSERITYQHGDAIHVLRKEASSLDAVFFHASLHHFADPMVVLKTVASALKPNGWLYLDEYVGPSRTEWSWRRLVVPNIAYYSLPRRLRRPRIVRAPINREDPTEAVASAAILPALRATFAQPQIRPYGGNLLAVIYPNLRRPGSAGVTGEAFSRAVQRLLRMEELVLRFTSSYYVVALAQKRVLSS